MTGNLDGGAALHLNLDEHLSKEQYKHLMKVAIKTGCSYWTVNVPNTICNDCGHISKHHLDHCEKCGMQKYRLRDARNWIFETCFKFL